MLYLLFSYVAIFFPTEKLFFMALTVNQIDCGEITLKHIWIFQLFFVCKQHSIFLSSNSLLAVLEEALQQALKWLLEKGMDLFYLCCSDWQQFNLLQSEHF